MWRDGEGDTYFLPADTIVKTCQTPDVSGPNGAYLHCVCLFSPLLRGCITETTISRSREKKSDNHFEQEFTL